MIERHCLTTELAKITLRILVVHSSAGLYGSDRSLLDFVRLRPDSIDVTVALPESGPLLILA